MAARRQGSSSLEYRFILDEPTNNLDVQNTDILIKAISEYNGTLLVVSHDEKFLKEMKINKEITLR